MQFNSVQSGNFLTGAKSVTDAATEIYDTAQETGFQVDQVIKQANVNEAVKKVAAARRNALAAKTGLELTADVKTEDIKTKRDKAIRDIWRPAVRMEGINRMAGSVAAGAYIMDEAKKYQKELKEEKDWRNAYRKKWEENEKRKDTMYQQAEEINMLKIKKLKQELGLPGSSDSPTVPDNKPSTTSQNSTQANQPEITSLNTAAYTGSLESLSPEDKKWIAFGVSGESKPNTDDDFGVASVILTRMKNRNQSAYNVVHAPGQFAAVVGTPGKHGPTAKHVPGLVDRLFSPEGMAKIEEATKKLDGRAYFKGQEMLRNRSSRGNKDYNKDGKPDMDPMFHPLGNFYHYGHQS